MKTVKIIISVLLISISNISISQEWNLAKEKNGIIVYARDIPDSQFDETKVSATFNTTKEKFIEFIWNVENYPNWQKDYKISKVLKHTSNNDKIIYFEFNAPWPIANRDIVINMKEIKEKDATYLYTHVEKSILASKEGIIRMSKYDGFWKIKELENGIEVTLQMATNPEGKIPAFLIDFYKAAGPYNAFMNLKEIFK